MFGFEVVWDSKVIHILFVFGIAGMIMGSIDAIRANNIRRMIAFSSVAQIGYIYMGFGLGTAEGFIASIFHMLSHAATKSLLFVSASGLTEVSDRKAVFCELTGAGFRNKMAGIAFTVGSLSMVGFPAFSGFISKLLFAQAAVGNDVKVLPTMIALAISTVLNTVYFLKTVIRIYTPVSRSECRKKHYETITMKQQPVKFAAMICFIVINLILGLFAQPIVTLITEGLNMFA